MKFSAIFALAATALVASASATNCRTNCQEIYKPVCGSDGVTYPNECEFNMAKCQLGDAGKDLVIKLQGECGSESKRALEAMDVVCDNQCLPEYEPVCGTDGTTYPNKCVLEVAKCVTRNPMLRVKKAGRCDSDAGSKRSLEAMDVVCENPCGPLDNEPVCGSDGKTYPSECVLEVAQCVTRNPLLRVKKDGPC